MTKIIRLLLPAVAVLACAPVAQANEGFDTGTWDSGLGTGSCTSGATTRTCTYDINYTNCQEGSVATGTGANVVFNCAVHIHGSVTVQPRVNAAGKVVGCTSVVGTSTGYAAFDSNVSSDFDRTTPSRPLTDVTVQSAHPDQSAAAVHFVGIATNGTFAWTVDATMTGTCAPAKSSSNSIVAGTVVVAARTPPQ